jgi:hypothetical protein
VKTFGRFEFKSEKPAESYTGDYMTLERDYVRIFEGSPESYLSNLTAPRLVAVVHLDSGQSVREIKAEGKNEKITRPASTRKR